MQEHDETISTANFPSNSQSKLGTQRLARVFIVAASVRLLIDVGLLIQVYITHQPAFELPKYIPFTSAKNELLEYYSFLVYMAGGLTLFIALSFSMLSNATSRKSGYISVSIGTVLILCSFWLSYTSDKLEKEWWSYFTGIAPAISLIVFPLSELVVTERKHFRNILNLIWLTLLLASCVLSILNDAYQRSY